MALVESNLAQITARAGVMRAGTGRAACAPKSYELKVGSGEIIWDRPPYSSGTLDGDPSTNTSSWTTERE